MSNVCEFESQAEFTESMQKTRKRLQEWGQWANAPVSSGLGYGQNTLARFVGLSRRADDDSGAVHCSHVPVNELECAKVHDLVKGLSVYWQQLLNYRYVQKHSVRYTAKLMGLGSATVQKHTLLAVIAINELLHAPKKPVILQNQFRTVIQL